jgi:Neocarzinostatin family
MVRMGVRAAAVAVVVVASVVGLPAAAPAGAQAGMALTLSATTGLRDGQVVDYELTGMPTAQDTFIEVRQCDDPMAAGVPIEQLYSTCRWLDFVSPLGETSHAGSFTVAELYESNPAPDYLPAVDVCSEEPFDCAIVAFVVPPDVAIGDPVEQLASAPFDMVPSPLLVHGDGLLGTGASVDVWVAGAPGTTVRLAQCVNYQEYPGPPEGCAPGTEVVLPAGGRATLQLPVTPTLDVAGQAVDCRRRPCEVTSFDAAGTTLGAARIPGSPPAAELTLDRTTGLASGTSVHVRVDIRSDILHLVQCTAAVFDDTIPPTEGCRLLEGSLGAGVSERDVVLLDTFTGYTGGRTLACADHPGGCIVALGREDGSVSAYVPVTFAGPASSSLTPASGLLDGQDMAFTATGLAPGEEYRLLRCHDVPVEACEPIAGAEPVVASADGTASATVAATQRLTDPYWNRYCRDRCSIALSTNVDWPPATSAAYAMAEGELTAAPATGLADGQAVTVSGTGLMPNYDGRTILFVTSGAWGLVQCDRAVVDDPTILGLFTHCSAPPPGGALDVPGATFTTEVGVAAGIDRILGGTTDCTSAAGACVLAAGRVEQDGSLTLLTTPLAFAGASGG